MTQENDVSRDLDVEQQVEMTFTHLQIRKIKRVTCALSPS